VYLNCHLPTFLLIRNFYFFILLELKIKMKQVKDLSIEELGKKIEELTDAKIRKIFNGKCFYRFIFTFIIIFYN